MGILFWDENDFLQAVGAADREPKRKRILVVDDDETVAREIETILQRDGFSVEKAHDGLEARVLLCHRQYDLVLSDIYMPILDGVGLFQFVQETDRVPFILMSGFTDLRRYAEENELDFAGLLSKPFGREDLLSVVTAVLDQ